MAKSKKRKKVIFLSLIILVVGILTAVAILKKKEAMISVQKEKVKRRNLTELVVANGKIQPVVQVKISPEVSGEITELPIKEGQCVKKGDLLVKIKPDNYVASRNSSMANYKYSVASSNTAWANLQKAQLEYKRNEELYRNRLISDSAYLEAKTTFDVAAANLNGASQQVEMAHASLQKAEDDLSKTTIYSPLEGTVTKLNSQKGERVVGTAMMAGTEIMTISDLNEMETRVDIGEIDVVLIQVGQKARLEVDAFKDRKFSGTVTEIANSAKNSSNMTSSSSTEATKFEVKIRIEEKEAFRPGMSVSAEIETRYRTNVLTVPIQSVTTRLPKDSEKKTQTNSVATAGVSIPMGDGAAKRKVDDTVKPIEVVFLLDGERVKMFPVKRGISDDNYVEIIEGLKEEQDVVSGGYKAINRELEDGKLIRVTDGKSEAVREKK